MRTLLCTRIWKCTSKYVVPNRWARAVASRHCSSAPSIEGKWLKPAGFDTGLTVYNSLTKRKEPLILAEEGVAKWYSCGPTVYDHAHLGHACSYVRFDILQRTLSKVFGINVIHVMVITDIDDKIIRRSLEAQVSPTVLARMYEEDFKEDMLALKVIPPVVYMRVTENVAPIVAFIEQIIKNGHGYATASGDVYFDVRSVGHRYGKLMSLGEPVGESEDSEKRDVRDFALWKAAKPQEPFWESPWGPGRPGWHIECSTVASSVFGSQLDIHSGGIDLAFPHHENEIAQCEAHHQCQQWGNYFLHSGHLHLKGSAEKMSKSLKNFITIKDFLQSYNANEFRLFCLLTKYRSGIEYSDRSMNEARTTLATIRSFTHDAQAYIKGQLQCQPIDETVLWQRLASTQSAVRAALADDFDTPRAVDAIMTLIHQCNCQLQTSTKTTGESRSPAVFGAVLGYIRDMMEVFGVDLLDRKDSGGVDSSGVLQNVVEQLVNLRSEVRNFALEVDQSAASSGQGGKKRLHADRQPLLKACDTLRKDLAPLGINVKDRGRTSTWEIELSRRDKD